MINAIGEYEWKLIDKYTGEICESGNQHNIVTDSIMYHTRFGSHSTGSNGIIDNYRGRISLGDNPIPLDTQGENILTYGVVHKYMNVANISGVISPSITSDDNYNSFNYSTNFSPLSQGITHTYTCIALELYNGIKGVSYLEFNEPITQDDTQYLYITYKLTIGLDNANITPFQYNILNNQFNSGGIYALVYDTNSFITSFISPINTDRIGICPKNILTFNDTIYSHGRDNNGSTYSALYEKQLTQTSYYGPIGTHIYSPGCTPALTNIDKCRLENSGIIGYSSNDISPSIARKFKHADGRFNVLYSDPDNPPSSVGDVIFSGIPTNRYPANISLLYTKTGKAIDVDDGEQGEYKVGIRLYGDDMWQMQSISLMVEDDDGTMHLGDGFSGIAGSSDVVNPTFNAVLSVFNDSESPNNIYSIQRYNKGNIINICMWERGTVESSIYVTHIDNSKNMEFRGDFIINTIYYMYTSSGLYSWDMTTPSTQPALLSINGIDNTQIFDIVTDDVTGDMWIGASDGLYSFDLDTLTAVAVDLSSLDTDEYRRISNGQLSASNGLIFKGGLFNRSDRGEMMIVLML